MTLTYSFEIDRDEFEDFEYDVDDHKVEWLLTHKYQYLTQDEFTKMSEEEIEEEFNTIIMDYFWNDAHEEFRESKMDPYDFYGVSRSDFF